MKCLVTGATGFIGTELCARLLGEQAEVLVLSRTATPRSGATSLVMDLTREQPAAAQLVGVDTVFHLAGIAHQRAAESDYEALNVRATRALAESARAAGVGCFVFLSSVKAEHREGAYGSSKARAEQALADCLRDSDTRLVVIRPALVYGRGVRGNLASLRRAVAAGLPRPPAEGGRSMIALPDLVDLLLDIARDPPPDQTLWTVTDGEVYSTQRLYDAVRAAYGGRPRRPWPLGLWRAACAVLDLRGAHPSWYQRLFGTEVYDGSAVLAARNWRPRRRFEDLVPEILESDS